MSKWALVSIGCAALALISASFVLIGGGGGGGDNYSSSLRESGDLGSRSLMNYRLVSNRWNFDDPRSTIAKDDAETTATLLEPLQVCNRPSLIPHEEDLAIHAKYAKTCPLRHRRMRKTSLLLLDGVHTYGRTGNNIIELLHAFQYAKDHDMVLGIMQGTWATQLITDMWMAVQDEDINAWAKFMEQSFCVKIFRNYKAVHRYKSVTLVETRDLFLYRNRARDINEYVEFQSDILRTLYRSYNRGVGLDARRLPVKDMCSAYDAVFGSEIAARAKKGRANKQKQSQSRIKYSVIHSRTMESAGIALLGKLCGLTGCHKTAALNMEPDYIKAILEPLGMLQHPIVLITDNQRPEVLEKLLADPDIGPMIQLIPEEASWRGGDITIAALADVFIGNPASSFTGFIAKSRVALGYYNNYLLRRKYRDGSWEDVCGELCIFDKEIMKALA